MQFKDIIGQPAAKQLLSNLADAARIPHAQLLLGPPGSGGLPLALAFAQYVLCENKTNGDSCGVCQSCNKAARLIHPDIHFTYPVFGAKVVSTQYLKEWRQALEANPYMDVNQWLEEIGADNKQGNITAEECTQIIRKLSLKSFESDYKILIIWLPEYLGKEGNRLLKMIEEPPEQTLFLLVSENQELILSTILSRCQLVRLYPLSDEAVEEALVQRANLPSNEARAIAQLVDGNVGEAFDFATHTENDKSSLFLEWMRKCYVGNGVELVSWAERLSLLGREKQKHLLHYATHFLRELLVLKLTDIIQIRLRPDELDVARRMSKVISIDNIDQLSHLFDQCTYHIERNANPRILFLNTSIRMHKIMKN